MVAEAINKITKMSEDLLYQVAITFIEKVGPVKAKQLISYCGSVKAVFEANKKSLLKIPSIGPRMAEHICNKTAFRQAEEELRFIEKAGIQTFFYLDQKYPERLKPFPDAPVMLYFKGNTTFNADRVIAIVGTRTPSKLGIANCEELLEQILPFQPLIVSGLAYGVDICAHRKCVDLGIPNIGVLGHGLQRIYPATHRGVAEKMIENGGLLTEFHSKTLPDREHFPMRNRIIAAMCDALIVIETNVKGGSVISAKLANGYNKDVFAFPGRVNDTKSKGCNMLIKSHQASLIETVNDLVYVMRWNKGEKPTFIQKQLFYDLGEDEKYIVDLLRQEESLHIDQLMFATKKTNSEMVALLLEMEFNGILKSLPGKHYMLII